MKKPKQIAATIYKNEKMPVSKTFFGDFKTAPDERTDRYIETHLYHLQLNVPLSEKAISKIEKSIERFAMKY